VGLRLASIQIAGAALLALVAQQTPAAAQGLFDSLMGGGSTERQILPRHQYAPRYGNSYSDPYSSPSSNQSWGQSWGQSSTPPTSSASAGTGRSVAYCVRLCDGRYFPMQRHSNATSIQLCSAFCPAAKTQVFNGSAIDHAVASGGARYADLDNAFVYREKVLSNCTCNGKDAFGLAKIDVASDPTLRPGDIVSSGDNVKVALTAMAASKERQAASEQSTQRKASQRVANRRGVVEPAAAPVTPSADSDEKPED
jgi:hypothetical protein